MIRMLIAAALLAIPTAALACSCINTDDPEELRTMAPEVAEKALALVEVETLVSFDQSRGAGDKMRVVRSIAGGVTGEFRVERGPFPSGASCDQLFRQGERATVLLFDSKRTATDVPVYGISGLCTGLLLQKHVFRDEVARIIGSRFSTERG